MTKKPVRKVKPVKAWALLYDGKLSTVHIGGKKRHTTQFKEKSLRKWGVGYTGPIRVTIIPEEK